MALDNKTITEVELSRVDPLLVSTRPGYSKSATLVFTNGKSDPRWKGSMANSFGATFPSFVKVDDTGKKCTGTCMIDLYALLAASKVPAWRGSPASLSPRSFRYQTVLTVVHELGHVNQGWQFGKTFWREYLEEEISATNRAADYSAANPDIPNSPYLQNAFENGARTFASRWADAHADDIHRGKFDFLLPMIVMRAIFPDLTDPFRYIPL